MKVVYLTPDMSSYRAASYQSDVAVEFANQHDVYFYGPGYPDYSPSDSITDILAKAPWRPDFVCAGHAWLSDAPTGPIKRMPGVDLSTLKLPKLCILNKEYARLDDKLSVIADQKFDVVLTHHHDVQRYERATKTKTVFWPFAFDHRKFIIRDVPREIDLFFSGLLRNPTHSETQNDLRIRVQAKLYYAIGELRLLKKPKFARYELMWNAFSGNRWITRLDRTLGRYAHIPDAEYQLSFNRSKICFCALSPLDLVSPRYFEAMASGCMVLCQRSERYEGLFEDRAHCMMFADDLSDFDRMLVNAIENDALREQITARAALHARTHHTWQRRVQQAVEALEGRTSSPAATI